MKIIELPGALIENRKKYRHKNLEKNKHAYVELRKQLVNVIKLRNDGFEGNTKNGNSQLDRVD